jgi:predicted nucleotidyltransferase
MLEFVEKNTIYKTIVGSTCYGLNTAESDIDIKGICIPPKEYYFGLQTFEQQEIGKDHVIYALKKFVNMAKDCNPNIIEMLYVDDKFIQKITSHGAYLRENRDMFLSQKAKYTFSGYAFAQLERIKGHRKWIMFNEKEPKQEDFFCKKSRVVNGETIIYDHFREHEYDVALKKWNNYLKWKRERNPKRAILEEKYGYDCKHAMHLIRLLRMGIEILTEGKVCVLRNDRQELLDIRNGKWEYDKLVNYAEELQEDVTKAYEKSTLPKTPNYNKINELLQKITEDFLKC